MTVLTREEQRRADLRAEADERYQMIVPTSTRRKRTAAARMRHLSDLSGAAGREAR